MSKFVVDPVTLQYVSNALAALSGEFAGITTMANGLTVQELGGRSVLERLEDFDASWRHGRMVIEEEIVGMSKRLATARQVHELIDQRIQEGATAPTIGHFDSGRGAISHDQAFENPTRRLATTVARRSARRTGSSPG